MKAVLALLAFTLATPALAAPDDWKPYLCTYGKYGERVLIRVNAKDQRVKIDDRDMGGIKFGQTGSLTFTGPKGMPWFLTNLAEPSTRVTVMDRNGPQDGACKQVDE